MMPTHMLPLPAAPISPHQDERAIKQTKAIWCVLGLETTGVLIWVHFLPNFVWLSLFHREWQTDDHSSPCWHQQK